MAVSAVLIGLMLVSALPVAAADEAKVRVLHASPDAPAVDVYLDDAIVTALTNVPCGVISDSLAIPAGEHNIKVYPTGDTTTPVIGKGDLLIVNCAVTMVDLNIIRLAKKAGARVCVITADPENEQAFQYSRFNW